MHLERLVGENVSLGWGILGALSVNAEQQPDGIAVVSSEEQLTFLQLRARVVKTAEVLHALGVERGQPVLVACDRSTSCFVLLLAISVAGAYFVPICPSSAARLRPAIAALAPRLVIASNPQSVDALEEAGTHVLSFSALAAMIQHMLPSDVGRQIESSIPSPTDPIYLMFTSGSSGWPKAVRVNHEMLWTFMRGHNARVPIHPSDRCQNTAPFYFDAFILDALLPLLHGATVILGPALSVPDLLLHSMAFHRATHVYMVGTVLSLVTNRQSVMRASNLSYLRVLQVGAEVCSHEALVEWQQKCPALTIVNSYGPTEATVGCLSYVHPAATLLPTTLPLGTPHADVEVRLLAKDGSEVQSPGIVGEIIILGTQVANGYAAETGGHSEAFFFLRGQRAYRSGDFAYWNPNRELCFVGRRDDEVKIGGQRVHLQDIRRRLQRITHVRNVAVGVGDSGCGTSELIVALTLAPDCIAHDDLMEQIDFAFREFPSVCRPAAIGFNPEALLGPSGKLDERTSLAALTCARARHNALFFVFESSRYVPFLRSERQQGAA